MKLFFVVLCISICLASCSLGEKVKTADQRPIVVSTTQPETFNLNFAANDLDFSLLDENGVAHSMSYFKKYDFIVLIAYSHSCKESIPTKNIKYTKNLKSKTFHIISGLEPKRDPSLYDKKVTPLLFDRTDAVSRSFDFKNAGDFVILNPLTMTIMSKGNLKTDSLFIQKKRNSLDVVKKTMANLKAGQSCNLDYQSISQFDDVGLSISKSCMFCHTGQDTIELFNSQEQINHWKPMMLKTMRTGRMPAQPDNELLPLFNVSSNNDLKKITYWLASGARLTSEISKDMNEGQARYKSYMKSFRRELGQPTFILQAPTVHIPAKGMGFERLYKFDNKIDEDLFVVATKLHTNLKTTHHAHLHATQDEIPDSIFEDDKSGAMSAASTWGIAKKSTPTMINNQKQVGYVLNDQTVSSFFKRGGIRFEPGFVTKIPKGSKLSIEVHYDPTGVETTDNLKMEVYAFKGPVADYKVLKKMSFLPDFKSFKIMPMQKDYKVVMSYTTEKNITLYSYSVHLHYRGKSGQLKAVYPGEKKEQVLISFPRVQFKMYQGGKFEPSLFIPKGTKLISEVLYDNSDDFEGNPNPHSTIVLGKSAYFNESHLPRFFYYEGGND